MLTSEGGRALYTAWMDCITMVVAWKWPGTICVGAVTAKLTLPKTIVQSGW